MDPTPATSPRSESGIAHAINLGPPPLPLRIQQFVAALIGLGLLFFAMQAAFTGSTITYVQRPLFLLAVIAVSVLLYPSRLFREGSYAELFFNLFVIAAAAYPTHYLITHWADLLWESYLTVPERWMAVALVFTVFEAARRTTAAPLIFVVAVFVLYAVYGRMAPGTLNHAGVTWENTLRITVLGSDGMFGTPLAFAAGFVTIFVFFTTLLNVSGAGNYLLNLAFSLAGTWRGGAGKVAVVGSAMMGMVSGSGVTNVLTTGTITIPMMKRSGYQPAYAGGVEAVASQGSQFVPPILGAAAFLMAEYTRVPFITIAGLCLVPAFLYYLSIFCQVHLRACKEDIAVLRKDELPPVGVNALKSLILFVPMTVLIVLLFRRFPIDYSIGIALIILAAATCVLAETRMLNWAKIKELGIEGGRTLASISAALALAGIVVGTLLLTGLGARLASLITSSAGDSLFVALFLVAVVAVVLGMGVVTVGAYVIVASLTAPLLVDQGLPLIVAHLFIFYYATLSGLSPPVAVVIFAAAGVANASALRVAWYALRLGFVAWLVPFIFAFHPEILGLNGITVTFVVHLMTATVGVIAFSCAFEGYAVQRASVLQRLLFAGGGVLLLYPTVLLAAVGAGLLSIAVLLNWRANGAAVAPKKLRSDT